MAVGGDVHNARMYRLTGIPGCPRHGQAITSFFQVTEFVLRSEL